MGASAMFHVFWGVLLHLVQRRHHEAAVKARRHASKGIDLSSGRTKGVTRVVLVTPARFADELMEGGLLLPALLLDLLE
eukprot:CAMPEP_0206600560 /NCGR_PEP_ID=MMETSP0325_2-20121206/45900_1 /ASSEMBLY_ACC=CAM_ASM_000347 /TAXON_ID=2866 /ORGANISM="Crypthecodinium cohnii, Strain Seligo" /LENGTH=78 /DNA_ID=CAMNT_0054111951 /DNA_START=328 /DNA_END=565 /DNA_ORIENTATION=-